MPPVTQLDTPPLSPKSPARKRPKFSLTLKKPKAENGESGKNFYPIFSSPVEESNADCSSPAQRLCLPLPHVGLLNHGNICYSNAVLQVLRHCPGLASCVESVARRLESTVTRIPQEGTTGVGADQHLLPLLSKLDKLLHLMKVAELDYGRTNENCEYLINRKDRVVLAVDPLDFMDCFRELNPMFQGHLQHDSQEFLCTLLVNIQDAIKQMDRRVKTDDAKNMTTLLNQKSATANGVYDQNIELEKLDFVREMFQGRLVIQTKCLTCEGVKKRFEGFQDVSVPVEKEHPAIDPQKIHHFSPAPKAVVANEPTLSRALSQFATVDYLYGDNKYFCENCCTHAEAEITTHFDVLPEVFTVHFKRFKADSYFGFASGWVNKITSNLETPSRLSLKQWCSQTCSVQDSTYELFGIVMHSGTSSCSGHYQAYVKVIRDDYTAKHTDKIQDNAGTLAATKPTSSPGICEDGCTSHVADVPKAVPTSQSAKQHKNGYGNETGSSKSPQNPAETPKADSTLKPGITKYFHKLAKNTSELTISGSSGKSSQPKLDNDSSSQGKHKNNTENRDSVTRIHSFDYQTPKGKPSVNRKLQYEAGRGKDLFKTTGSSSCNSAEIDNAESSIQDDEISSSGNGDTSNTQLSGWFHFDDGDVYTLQESDLTSVLSSADSSFTCPYLLFYKRAATV